MKFYIYTLYFWKKYSKTVLEKVCQNSFGKSMSKHFKKSILKIKKGFDILFSKVFIKVYI